MNPLTVVVIAFGLAMDAFAVSIASGVAVKELKLNHALRLAAFFGGFQALMPLAGWLAGIGLRSHISRFDHWLAFVLLSFIGLKMIHEALKRKEEEKEVKELKFLFLLVLAVATSIDALVVGLSLSFVKVAIAVPAMIIGAVTFVLSLAGAYIGKHVGHFFENKMEIAGGLILIGIGTKILLEHLLR